MGVFHIRIIEASKTLIHKVLFFVFNLLSVDNKKIVFITLHSNEFIGNNKVIYEKLKESGYEYKFILYGMDDIKLSDLNFFQKLRKTVKIDYDICTARYVIVNDYFSLFTRVKIREETDLIQVWHGAGAFKKFGKHSLQNYNNPQRLAQYLYGSSQYTKVIVSSNEVSEIFASAFGVDKSKIYPIGIPRADVFSDKKKIGYIKRSIYCKYKQLLDKKVILYAPTFRDDKKHLYQLELDLNYILEKLSNDYIIVLKIHPRTRKWLANDIVYSHRVLDLSNEDINDLLIVTDYLITDYSSVIFEFALLNRPMIFFAYDLEEYENEIRGFYYDYEGFVPGPIVKTTEDVVKVILQDEWDFDKIESFAKRFNANLDGKATERFIEEVLCISSNDERTDT